MILPVLSLYTGQLSYATETLIGVALGIYGLTQALLQIPFGMISDRVGRKPVILFGLLLFIMGSVLAALSHSIYGVITGRALQGAGAIGSTLTALVADSTSEQSRLRAMALIGILIGMSFVIAMILGPLLNAWIGLSGIFWLTALLAATGIAMLLWKVPTPSRTFHPKSESALTSFKKVAMAPALVRLDIGIFILHAMLMALFVALPLLLKNLGVERLWLFYLPVLFWACILMAPFMRLAEKKPHKTHTLFLSAILVITLTLLALWKWHNHVWLIGGWLCLFFSAFTLLEGMLPSQISKTAPPQHRGTAMGIYSSAQFLGVFFGGAMGGVILTHSGITAVFLFCTVLGICWLMVSKKHNIDYNPPR